MARLTLDSQLFLMSLPTPSAPAIFRPEERSRNPRKMTMSNWWMRSSSRPTIAKYAGVKSAREIFLMLPVALANVSCGTVPIAMPARKAPKTMLTLSSAAAATNRKQRKRANLEWDVSISTLAFDLLSQRRMRGRTSSPDTRKTTVRAIVKDIDDTEGAEAPATPVAMASPA